MPIPSEFYYQEAVGRVSYTRVPTGNLSINQLVLGKPFFVMNDLQREPKQKKLILSDWSAPYWSATKRKQAEAAMSSLIDQGFALYIWQDGAVCRLTKTNLSDYLSIQNRQKITPVLEADLLNAASRQQSITSDQLQVLDDYWLEAAIDNDYPAERVLRTADLFRLNEAYQAKALQMISRLKPAVERIIYDGFPTEDLNNFYLLDKLLPNIPVELSISAFSKLIDRKEKHVHVFERIAVRKPPLAHIIYDENPPFDKYGNDINEIFVRNFPTAKHTERIKRFRGFTPHQLLSMALSPQARNDVEEIQFPSDCYAMWQFATSPEDLNALLTKFPNIRKICVSHFTPKLKQGGVLFPLSESLEEIQLCSSFDECEATPNFLKSLLKGTPNLRSFYSKRLTINGTGLDFLGETFPSLQTLDLIESNISCENLEGLLSATLNIETLNLKQWKPLSYYSMKQIKSLKFLKSFDPTFRSKQGNYDNLFVTNKI